MCKVLTLRVKTGFGNQNIYVNYLLLMTIDLINILGTYRVSVSNYLALGE